MQVGGPFFDDLSVGDVFESLPVTLTDGRAAAHQAVVGCRLRLALDEPLARSVTGRSRPLASPALVWDVAIGQSTVVTQRVVANIFYRGLAFGHAPSLGDTLRTRTEVAGLKQNRSQPTGLAALRMTTTDQEGRTVLDFWRCAMLPLRDPAVVTSHRDDLASIGAPLDTAKLSRPTQGWDLDRFRKALPDGEPPTVGTTWQVHGGDVVSSAPELARLTGNVAAVHHDRTATGQDRRLVYGGHVVGLALLQATRAVPGIVTVLGWHGCDHLGPVYEDDTLFSTVTVTDVQPADQGAQLVHLRSLGSAQSAGGTARDVLDWHYVVLVA